MSPDPDRIIPASLTEGRQIESFPYFEATFTIPLPEAGEEEDEQPLGASLSTPEEDTQRLASVDQIIHEKLQMAEQQAQEIARRAYEEGFASGEAEGRAFGESQFKIYAQRLDNHLAELSRMGSLLGQAAKDEVLALALTIGEYLAGQQIEESQAGIRPLLDSILEKHPFPAPETGGKDMATLEVFLNPKDLEKLGESYPGHPGIRLVEDAELSRGSLRVTAPEGVLEATLERRRERLMEVLHRFREEAS